MIMDVSVFFARFWGVLFILLGGLSAFAKLLERTIKLTDDKAVTVSTGYITFLLGLVTVILHDVYVFDWRLVITLLGWTTLFKGLTKIGFPGHVNKRAQSFKAHQSLWGVIIMLFGIWMFYMSFTITA